jgi:nucleoside-diphosphate-sugar epimerase
MKALVTGATGFIGRHLVERLVNDGVTVRGLCRRTADVSSFTRRGIEICWGDVVDSSAVETAVQGCDQVFHLAAFAQGWAKDPRTYFDINVYGLQNVLSAAQRASVEKVVYTSSSVTLGPSNGTPVNEASPRPQEFLTVYEQSKYMAEQKALSYVRSGLNVIIVCPTRVFGPGILSESNSLTRMIQQYLGGNWRLILGDGNEIGNYVYVHDVVEGHLLAMERGRPGERYLLGGENASYNELFEIVSELSGCRYRLFHVPGFLALLTSEVERFRGKHSRHHPLITPAWVRTFIADWAFSTEKARVELGCKITPLRQALAMTIEWLQQLNENQKR